MIHLALDVESSGLPKRGIDAASPQQPWAVSVGLVLFNDADDELGVFSSRIRADGRRIEDGASAVHGITDREAARTGISEIAAMAVVCGFAAQAHVLTGYSVKFDRGICESTLARLGKDARMLIRPGLQVIDLIEPAAAYCKIASDHDSGSYRWPSLDVACQQILGEPPREGAHNALSDAQRARRLYRALRNLNLIEAAA